RRSPPRSALLRLRPVGRAGAGALGRRRLRSRHRGGRRRRPRRLAGGGLAGAVLLHRLAGVAELGEDDREADVQAHPDDQADVAADRGVLDEDGEDHRAEHQEDGRLAQQPVPRNRSRRVPRHALAPAPLTLPAALHWAVVRVGILTGGGDCPGLNAVIRAIVRKGELVFGDQLVGFLDAWDGVIERRTMPLDVSSLRGMLPRGGTLLGTRRGSPYDHPGGAKLVADTMAEMQLDALVVIGGNGSLTVADMLYQDLCLPIVGVPKTIDNDIVGTDLTFGFTTAVQIATDAIDRLHTTAESHDRVMVVEVMGRHAGWIATYSGLAGGADLILIPEEPFDIEEVCDALRHRHQRGANFSIVVTAEGAMPKEGTMELQAGET